MNLASAKSRAHATIEWKNKTIASIEEQYGKNVAAAVDEISCALVCVSGMLAMDDPDPISKIMMVDMGAKLVARTAHLCEKAYGYSHEQGLEVISMAKEIHTKIMQDGESFTEE